MALAGSWVVQNQTSEAAGRPIEIPAAVDTLAVDVNLLDHGRVQIDDTLVPGSVNFFQEYDELRYLIVDQPDVFLKKLDIRVHFPRPVTPDSVKASTIIVHDPDTTTETSWLSPTILQYSIRDMGPTATITLVATMPKGLVVASFAQQLFGTVESLPQIIWLALAVVLPVLALVVLSIVLLPQMRQRRMAATTDIRSTPPENLPPAVAAALVDGQVSARAIAATLLDLARRDYIEIASHDGTYTFTKRRRLLEPGQPKDLLPFEEVLLSKIFSGGPQATEEDIRVRIGHRLFSQKVAAVYLGIYENVTGLGYFIENPSVVSGGYRLAGLGLFFFGILGFIFGAIFYADPPTPLLFWAGTIAAALIVIALAPRMPAHTARGIGARSAWLQFRNYLHSSAAITYAGQNQQEFFTYLPYAVALGVEVAWSGRFVESPFQLPEWYAPSANVAVWEDFFHDMFPIVDYLSRELAAIKEPTLS